MPSEKVGTVDIAEVMHRYGLPVRHLGFVLSSIPATSDHEFLVKIKAYLPFFLQVVRYFNICFFFFFITENCAGFRNALSLSKSAFAAGNIRFCCTLFMLINCSRS